jgi:hypothetical protein
MNRFPFHIGVDLDNTLIDYGPIYAAESERFDAVRTPDRYSVREVIRAEGEDQWQQFQAFLYTEGLSSAVPSAMSMEFLRAARRAGCRLSILSHKTVRTQERFGGQALRVPAVAWLAQHGISPGIVATNDVHFFATREEKIQAICSLDLDWFIDDLPEVLQHDAFPASTVGWLFDPGGTAKGRPHVDFAALIVLLSERSASC